MLLHQDNVKILKSVIINIISAVQNKWHVCGSEREKEARNSRLLTLPLQWLLHLQLQPQKISIFLIISYQIFRLSHISNLTCVPKRKNLSFVMEGVQLPTLIFLI